jgi:hypothetical protein
MRQMRNSESTPWYAGRWTSEPQTRSGFDGNDGQGAYSHLLQTLVLSLGFHFLSMRACVLSPFQVQYRTMSNMYGLSVRFSLITAFLVPRA